VYRHGKMVLGVCRRLLCDEHEAEDAFQATFLALARHAGSIRGQSSAGGWLYRVAYRTALDARARTARRAARQQELVEAPSREREPDAEAADRELLRVIEAEVDRLPERYRVPFVRRCAGETSTAIARDLGCPPGTVESWLTRARQRLRAGLLRRGVAPPVGALAAVLAARDAPACVPARLVTITVRAAVGRTAGAGAFLAGVAALREGVRKAMRTTRWKIAAACVLTVGALGTGAALLPRETPAAPPAAGAEPVRPAAAHKAGPGTLFVHVLFPPNFIDLLAQRNLHARLLAIDPDTGKWQQVVDDGGFSRVSPDGHTLLFTRERVQIWSYDVRGREEPKRLSDKGGKPSWSPDGKQFVTTPGEITGDDGWKTETWRVNADGSGATKLPVPDTDFVEDWSADGRWFVTCSDRHPPRGRGYQLYLMHPDATGQRRLTRGAGLNCYPRFSHDGRRLVYLHQERGVNSLHVMDVDGTNDRTVVKEEGLVTPDHASWSPDGKRLAVVFIKRPKPGATDFLGNPIRETYRLEIMDADGGNRKELKLRLSDDVPLVPLGIGCPDWHAGSREN
jgi:RNA polymerase sigma factor (sigma-70 family)